MKRLTIAKRLEQANLIAKFLAGRFGKSARASESNVRKPSQEIAELLSGWLENAFSKADLDVNNDAHQFPMLVGLAYFAYGMKGRPRTWTPAKRKQLFLEVKRLKEEIPSLKEIDCCKLLVKGRGKRDWSTYQPSRLLRVYQEAKMDRILSALD